MLYEAVEIGQRVFAECGNDAVSFLWGQNVVTVARKNLPKDRIEVSVHGEVLATAPLR